MWEFSIDVGGTFTDLFAISPTGRTTVAKVLSSAITKGRVDSWTAADTFNSRTHTSTNDDFWKHYDIRFLDSAGTLIGQSRIKTFSAEDQSFRLEHDIDNFQEAARYELSSGEEAPLLAIRQILGLKLIDPIPPCRVRLGTTRGTNALLERKGVKTLLVTTAGFGDVLEIGYQNRPKLFELAITKPDTLTTAVLEAPERIDFGGNIVRELDIQHLRGPLEQYRSQGIESVAICLLHAIANSIHEQHIEQLAREIGFKEISVSSQLSPLIRFVARADTTTLDAYLNPILREYIQRLESKLPDSELLLMNSAGGLVTSNQFTGKESLLSGPAGGVVGYSRIGQECGFDRSIGFDMGGTSTDVCRFDGHYDREYETTKAGVRVVTPMMAIETVAAGGGSLCSFDGIRLKVGPESAGADPGPACYGRGGPLAVTDINLFLGYLPEDQFPFALDHAAVRTQLTDIRDHITQSSRSESYTLQELAEGFRRIANANMARAIRQVSVAKGYNPADYLLVSFGGAGGQHACALARLLGMSKVLIHPLAGILSAYGLHHAARSAIRERSLLKSASDIDDNELRRHIRELEAEGLRELSAEAIATDKRLAVSLEMRYRGTESTIDVRVEHARSINDVIATFTEHHRRLFGDIHAERSIEIVVLRVEVTLDHSELERLETVPNSQVRSPESHRKAWFAGEEHNVGIIAEQDLQPGDQLVGPVIVTAATSTTLIEPGFFASVLANRALLIEATGGNQARNPQATESDPIRLEIFNSAFASIAEQMGETLRRTAFSANVKERLDFSCALFTAEGDLVANAPHIPVHLGAMGETIRCLLRDVTDIRPGDVYITNDPYAGGSHLPDVTVVTPVFARDNDELLFFTANRAHHAEIGGIVPGSMPPFSKNLAEEGVLIRNFLFAREGEVRERQLRDVLVHAPYPSRTPDDNLADIHAQVAANQFGVKLIHDLIAQQSQPVVLAFMRHIRDAATEKMRQALRNLENGRYKMTDSLDDDTPITASIEITDDQATIDFTGTGAVLSSNLNANRGIVTAAVMYVMRCLINEDIPLNSGVLDPLEIILPECLLNPSPGETPEASPAVLGGNVETSQRLVDVLLGALQLAAASQGTMNNLTFGDDTFGYYETICGGGGATATTPGADAVQVHMTNTRMTDVEILERGYPVRVREFEVRANSGGEGEHSGGDGVIRELEFLKPLSVAMLSQRRTQVPYGMQGGQPGAPGRNQLIKATGETIDLGGSFQIEVQPGDILRVETPGGGGWGEPD